MGAAYDAISPHYDAAVAEEAWMRRLLWRHHERLFPAGARVLDLACGTGLDTLHHAARGVRMTAVDLSIGMLSRLAARALRCDLARRIRVAACDLDRLPIADLAGAGPERARSEGTASERFGPPPFDGMIASFAGLNTLAEPSRFAAAAAELLRPGGRLVGHFLSPFDLWGGRIAGRRSPAVSRSVSIAGREIVHHVLPADELYRRWFARSFDLRRAYALGFLWPHGWSRRLPAGLAAAMGRLEPLLGRGPVLGWGRFIVLDLEKPASRGR